MLDRPTVRLRLMPQITMTNPSMNVLGGSITVSAYMSTMQWVCLLYAAASSVVKSHRVQQVRV